MNTPPPPDAIPEFSLTEVTPIKTESSENPSHLEGDAKLSQELQKPQQQYWEDLERFYRENENTIQRSMAVNTEGKKGQQQTIDVVMVADTFVETTKTILDGLVALGNVHPIIGVAVFAFHSVISLELMRRDNNKKVAAVKVQMQNMMCALFQLRKLNYQHADEAVRSIQKQRLGSLITVIAVEIKACGSDLTYYLDRKTLSQLLNAKSYERQFAKHMSKFAIRRSELDLVISSYIAGGIDAANENIKNVGKRVEDVDEKLDAIVAVLKRLESPREQAALKFINKNGGPQNCIEKDDLWFKLLSKTNNRFAGKRNDASETDNIRASLKTELAENLEDVLKKNLSRFESMLKVQNNNLQHLSEQLDGQGRLMQDHTSRLETIAHNQLLLLEGGKVIQKAILPTSRANIKDPVLQRIWDAMGLKSSVKARNFVLTFRDYLVTGHSNPNSAAPTPRLSSSPLPSASPLVSPIQIPEKLITDTAPQSQMLQPIASENEDQWAVSYIDVAHLQPIVEAIDADGSGFISVKEANKFALGRPKGWSLLRWLAYWAAGWQLNLRTYRSQIYSIVQQIHKFSKEVLPANRAYVDAYLSHSSFDRLERLLRSLKLSHDEHRKLKDFKLSQTADQMVELEEQRMSRNLEEFSYLVESPAKALLVTGPGRVEKYMLPFLFLLLQRHLEIVKTSREYVVSVKEFASHSNSIVSIFSLFENRARSLEAIFRQTHRDVEAQFSNFAYGMFQNWNASPQGNPAGNTLLSWEDNILIRMRLSHNRVDKADPTILIHGKGPAIDFREQRPGNVVIPSRIPAADESNTKSIQGSWTGQCLRATNSKIAFQGFFCCSLTAVIDASYKGTGESYLGPLIIDGIIDDSTSPRLRVEFILRSETFADLRCEGQFNIETQIISGRWVVDTYPRDLSSKEDLMSLDRRFPCGSFKLTRTPASVYRFRKLLDDLGTDQALSISMQRWSFALQAVRFQVRERRMSPSFLRASLDERRRWVELTIRRERDKGLSLSKSRLSLEGQNSLWAIRRQCHPAIGRVYEAVAVYYNQRKLYDLGSYVCDSCGRRIIFTRYLCITCMEDDFTNQIDLCSTCVDTPLLSENGYEHNISHSLIRSNHRIHKCELSFLISQARLRSERIKSIFASLRVSKSEKGLDSEADASVRKPDTSPVQLATTKPLLCTYCDKMISTPCWVCVVCARDTFVCQDCDSKGGPVRKASLSHTSDHPMLRLHDDVEVKGKVTQVSRLEKQLSDMEARVDGGFATLEEKVNQQLETNFSNIVKQMEDRFHTTGRKVETHTAPISEVNERLDALDGKVETRLNMLEARVEHCLDALEHRVDSRLMTLESMLQQIIGIMPEGPRREVNIFEPGV